MKGTHSIAEISKDSNTNKTKIRRTIEELGINATNENTRKHKNSPKMYDNEAKKAILIQIMSETSYRNNAEQKHNSAEHEQNNETKDEIINILKMQLDRAYEEKKELTRSLKEAQQLVSQQQQLTLNINNEVKALKIEINEEKQQKKAQKGFFRKIFHKTEKNE